MEKMRWWGLLPQILLMTNAEAFCICTFELQRVIDLLTLV